MAGRREEYREKVKERQKEVASLIRAKLRDEIITNIEYNRLKNPVTYRDIHHQVRKKRRIWSDATVRGERTMSTPSCR